MAPLTLNIRVDQPTGLSISDNLNNRPNNASFVTQVNAPSIAQPLTITDPAGAGVLFVGNVQSYDMDFDADVAGSDAVNHLIYAVTALDPSWILNAKLPYGNFNNVSATTIVKQLIASFAPLYTTINVQGSLPAISIVFNRTQNLGAALSAIGQLVNCVWKVDYNNDVHFYQE